MTQTIYREVSRASAIARAAVLCISIFHVAISLGGTTYYYVGASNKWNTAACYSLTDGGDGGAGIPGTDDSIRISKDQTVYLDDSTIGFLNGVREVSFRADGAMAYIHLENDFDLGCWFGDVDGTGCTGVYIVKTGGGKLTFAKEGTDLHTNGKVDCYNYFIGLDIREGSVQLEPMYTSKFRHNYKNVKLASDTFLFGVTGGVTTVWSLEGAGMVTNLCKGTAELRIARGYDSPTVFSGILSGYTVFSPAGHTYFTSTDSTIGGSAVYPFNYSGGNAGIVGFMTLAGAKNQPSSLGRGDITGKDGPFYLLYLGDTGETIERIVTLGNTTAIGTTIDAGAHGGLVFTGDFAAQASVGKQQRLVLAGSNTVSCVFSNNFTKSTSNGKASSFYVRKTGCGTWRFADVASRNLTGVVAVEDGSLEFESIREAGLPSSLGYATDLYEDKCDIPDNLKIVPYAYLLGNGDATGTFRYVGEKSQIVTSRLIGLVGRGRIEAPNCAVLKWEGVTGVGAGEKSLAIVCAEGQTNYFANVTNGEGVVSIAKEGPGDLVLSGELSFGGDLSVSGGGTLTVRDISGELYRYYKLTLKETVGTSANAAYSDFSVVYNNNNSANSNSRFVALNEFGLYNAAGTRQNTHASETALSATTAELTPGHIAAEAEDLLLFWTNNNRDYRPWRLLDNGNSGGTYLCVKWEDMTKAPRLADPETWISVVMCVKDGADPITLYDLNFMSYRGEGTFIRTPTAFSISASADGLNYEELVSTNDIMHTQSTYYTWLSDGTSGDKPESAAHAKLPLPASRVQTTYNVLNNVRAISVAAGSSLKYEGATAPVVSTLAIDRAGVGTIDGFSFAENGVLSVRDLSPNATVAEIPAQFLNAGALGNIKKWSVEIDGQTSRRFRVASVSSTSIRICRRGYSMSFR